VRYRVSEEEREREIQREREKEREKKNVCVFTCVRESEIDR